MMKKSIFVLLCTLFFVCNSLQATSFELLSPDGHIKVVVQTQTQLTWAIHHEGDEMMAASPIKMSWSNGIEPGVGMKVASAKSGTGRDVVTPAVYHKKTIDLPYNHLVIKDKAGYSVEFRAYNQGAAYRIVANQKKPFNVLSEGGEFVFGQDAMAWMPYNNLNRPFQAGDSFESQFRTSFENTYHHAAINQLDRGRLAFLPVLVGGAKGKKVCITESDLRNYPGMFLYADGNNRLKSAFAPYPKAEQQGGHNNLQMYVSGREDYLAKCTSGESFPWRIAMVASNDAQLLDADLVYALAEPSRLTDVSWIKPGKVAWDWWNDWKLFGVDFKAGINNETYRYYIDFASEHGIEYVILDEGWTTQGTADLFDVVPQIDLPMLIEYGRAKNVGIILWAGYYAFEPDMEKVCQHYSAMGVKGFKIDFMDRDDQKMVDFTWKAAAMCAKYKLLANLHGMFKPAGLQRTYPNVLNFEGVHGLEQMKWAEASVDQVTYDVTIPFIRMVAGPFDYTQGAMRNASRHNYRPVYSEPMSQGTRCRQLAQYVVFNSPLNMMCDNPVNYQREPECAQFIAQVPVVWDQTLPLAGQVGEYVVLARQRGDAWYVGGMTNWDARNLTVDCSFLGEGQFKATIFSDGINAAEVARDYRMEQKVVGANDRLTMTLAPGGGFSIRFEPVE
ncbi:MAG: glycoside hydrolase family 97 protein [Breznakibacter sp.]